MRQIQAADGVFGQVGVGAGEELRDLVDVGIGIGHGLVGGAGIILCARVGHGLDRGPVAAEQFHQAIAAGLAVEAGDRAADLPGIGDDCIGGLLCVGGVVRVHGERVVAGMHDMTVPEIAHRGLQLGGRDRVGRRRGDRRRLGRHLRRGSLGWRRRLGIGTDGRFLFAAGRGCDEQRKAEYLERRVHDWLLQGVADATGAIVDAIHATRKIDMCKDVGGPTRTRTWNQRIHVLQRFPLGVDYLITRNLRWWGAGCSCLSLRALQPPGSLCTFRWCTTGSAQDCRRPDRCGFPEFFPFSSNPFGLASPCR